MEEINYDLELKHFIPLIGENRYLSKIINSFSHENRQNFPLKADLNFVGLTLYNVVLIGFAGAGVVKGIEYLLQ